jgi:hypothetical protein
VMMSWLKSKGVGEGSGAVHADRASVGVVVEVGVGAGVE